MLLASGCLGGESAISPRAVITTNYVIVTNVVLVTNYVNVDVQVPNSALNLDWSPADDGFDWIQLKTGEWLKGRIKAMQERRMEFFSEKLGDQSFAWKDIRQVRSPRTLDVLFVDGKKVSGPVSINPDQVAVGGDVPTVVARNDLQSITPGGSKERDYWAYDLSLGLTLQAGNTRAIQYNAQVDLQRRTPSTRLSLDYIGNISLVNGDQSANNHRINTEFDLWLSKRFYLILPDAEYYRDSFQNLTHRVTFGGGVGYDLIDRSDIEWNITSGPAYQMAWFESAEPGSPTEKGVAALTFGSRFKWDINRLIKWTLEYRGQYTSKEVGETTHHGLSKLSVDLNKQFTLDVSGIWDRITNPKVGSNGVQPEPDDFRLVVGVGVHF